MTELTTLDHFALFYFLLLVIGYGWLTNHGQLKANNIAAGVQRQRAKWMYIMLERDNRIIDSQILTSLSQGNAFFASTAMVITGALATALGSANEIALMLKEFPIPATASPHMIKLKLTFMVIIFLTAFFKFAWAYRITHYTSIMIGAAPLIADPNDPGTRDHIERTIKLAGLAGKHSNSGLHTYYYGIAAAGWLINAYIFMAAATLVVLVLYRREYLSNSHHLLNPGGNT